MPRPELADLRWRKSRHSGTNANCVEVAPTSDHVAVRDSKNPDGPALLLTPAASTALLTSALNAHE